MTIDPMKMKKFVDSFGPYPRPEPLASSIEVVSTFADPDALDEEDIEEISDDLRDDASEASELARKLDKGVGYMEISAPAGGFSCGTCKSFREGGACINPCVRAVVDGEKGCCNLFLPANAQILFPPQDEPRVLHGVDEEDEDEEDEDEEDEEKREEEIEEADEDDEEGE